MSTDKIAVLGVTGDDVVRLELNGGRPARARALISGIGAQRLAIDPRDPARIYVGTSTTACTPATMAGGPGETTARAGPRRPAGDVGRRVTLAPGVGDLGRLRRDRTEQPVPLNRRGRTLGAAAGPARHPERAAVVLPAPAMDPSRQHDRAAPDRPELARGRDRAGRRDALQRRWRLVVRPQPRGSQRRSSAAHASARPRPALRGGRPGDRTLGESRRQLEPARGRSGPALRLGGGDRSRRPRPLVRRRSAAGRSPLTAAATDRRTCGARAATVGLRSTPGATWRSCGGCPMRWRPCPASPARCWRPCAAGR